MSAGIISSFLLWAALLAFILQLIKQPFRLRILGAVAIVVSAIIPLFGLPVPLYIRAITGDLSILTQLLLAIYIINSIAGIHSTTARKTAYQRLCFFILFTGLWFYPTTLGLTLFDPYRYGYITDPMHLITLAYFFLGTLTLFFLKNLLTSSLLCLATISFYFGPLESTNYWDYMIDPVLTIGAIIYLFAGAAATSRADSGKQPSRIHI